MSWEEMLAKVTAERDRYREALERMDRDVKAFWDTDVRQTPVDLVNLLTFVRYEIFNALRETK